MGSDGLRERVIALAKALYGPGELELFVTAYMATVTRGDEALYTVWTSSGEHPLLALERHLKRRLR